MSEVPESDELLRAWMEALRSGEYSEYKKVDALNPLRETTKRKTRYTPLGVLCDLYDNTRWDIDRYFNKDRKKSWYRCPPDDLDELFGSTDFSLDHRHVIFGSFEDVANYIESTLLVDE